MTTVTRSDLQAVVDRYIKAQQRRIDDQQQRIADQQQWIADLTKRLGLMEAAAQKEASGAHESRRASLQAREVTSGE
jgi:cell division protein FtsL